MGSTVYHPTQKDFMDTILENWDILGDASTRLLYEAKDQLIFGTRRSKNLRDHLVRAQVKPPTRPTMFGLRQAPELHGGKCLINKRCPDVYTCRYCKRLDKTGNIKGKLDKRSFRTRKNICCQSNNLIYTIECTLCGMHYVGQTKRRLADRMVKHFNHINNEKIEFPLGHHFTRANGHRGLTNVKIYVLEFCQTPLDKALKKQREVVE